MTYIYKSDLSGRYWSLNYLYGVQGVASSNPAAPTIVNQAVRPIFGLAFLLVKRVHRKTAQQATQHSAQQLSQLARLLAIDRTA
jgi:hypothetical protein